MTNIFALKTLITFNEDCVSTPLCPIPVPRIVARGIRFPELLSEQEYLPIKERGRSQFDCSRCGVAVISGASKDRWLQSCRCSFLVTFVQKNRLRSAQQWTEWQASYDKESADPMPIGDIRINPLLGTLPELPQAVHDWVSRRQGLPSGIRYNWDRTITAGQAMISIGEQGTVTTFDPDDLEGMAKSAQVLRHIARQSEPPRYIIISGRDPDYVWPPGTDSDSIRQLPFRCPSCRAWVKGASIMELPCYDRALVCLCHSFIVRKDIGSPTNYRQWQELISMSKAAKFEHGAKEQKGDHSVS